MNANKGVMYAQNINFNLVSNIFQHIYGVQNFELNGRPIFSDLAVGSFLIFESIGVPSQWNVF